MQALARGLGGRSLLVEGKQGWRTSQLGEGEVRIGHDGGQGRSELGEGKFMLRAGYFRLMAGRDGRLHSWGKEKSGEVMIEVRGVQDTGPGAVRAGVQGGRWRAGRDGGLHR